MSRLIDDNAAAWLARLRSQDITNDDRAAFAAWLAAHPSHRRSFDELLDLWDVLGEAVAKGPLERSQSPTGRQRLRRWVPIGLAASLILAGATFLVGRTDSEHYATERGAFMAEVLRDGSTLELNTDSRVEVEFTERARRVRLERGEVLVTVRHDAARPFSVETRHGRVTAVGTTFSVRDLGDATRAMVLEGRVQVASAAGFRELDAGEGATFDAAELVAGDADPIAAASWRQGELVYDGVPLADLVRDLNRYLPLPMTIADPALGAERVSAVLRIDDQTTMLEALSRALPLRWTVVSDRLIVIRRA